MGITKSDSQYKGPETKDQYITPESEILEICFEGEKILVASDEYYYQGAPDD
jgi:hypothetical protein